MTKISVTLNEGQGRYNQHVMHYHVWRSHCPKFDDDDFNNFGGIACEGQTHRQTQTHTHRDLGHLNENLQTKRKKEEVTNDEAITSHYNQRDECLNQS